MRGEESFIIIVCERFQNQVPVRLLHDEEESWKLNSSLSIEGWMDGCWSSILSRMSMHFLLHSFKWESQQDIWGGVKMRRGDREGGRVLTKGFSGAWTTCSRNYDDGYLLFRCRFFYFNDTRELICRVSTQQQ